MSHANIHLKRVGKDYFVYIKSITVTKKSNKNMQTNFNESLV